MRIVGTNLQASNYYLDFLVTNTRSFMAATKQINSKVNFHSEIAHDSEFGENSDFIVVVV